MSTINTNGIDVNYPIPGQNNSTQGFRNNFTSIKTNLNTAGSEITDLQNKVVLKSALANTVLNNDMANTLIANASTLQFRATTYNLGNALVGNANVDCSLGDLQYGNLAGNVTLNFGSWAPTNTQSTVKLQLGRPNNEANYTITFSANAVINQNSGWSLLENSGSNGGLATITFPYDVTQINLTVTSTDCGNTLYVEPTNRPFQTTAIQLRTPAPTGFLGDVAGTVAVDEDYLYVCTASYNGDAHTVNAISVATANTLSNVQITGTAGQFSCNTAVLYANLPVQVSGTLSGSGSITGYSNPTTYYVIGSPTSTAFTLSATQGGPAITTTAGTTTGLTFSTNTLSSNLNFGSSSYASVNTPVIFDTMFANGVSVTSIGNINSGQVYYVKSVGTTQITLSDSRNAGVAGNTLSLTNVSTPNTYMDATFYAGTDIWKRVALSSW
jgi:hypothetical protein